MSNEHPPSEESALPIHDRETIDRLCKELEEQWRAGNRPRIEDYLEHVQLPLRAALLKGVIASEIDQRQAAGEQCSIDEYHQRFPSDRDAVEAGWAIIANRQDPSIHSTLEPSRSAVCPVLVLVSRTPYFSAELVTVLPNQAATPSLWSA